MQQFRVFKDLRGPHNLTGAVNQGDVDEEPGLKDIQQVVQGHLHFVVGCSWEEKSSCLQRASSLTEEDLPLAHGTLPFP